MLTARLAFVLGHTLAALAIIGLLVAIYAALVEVA